LTRCRQPYVARSVPLKQPGFFSCLQRSTSCRLDFWKALLRQPTCDTSGTSGKHGSSGTDRCQLSQFLRATEATEGPSGTKEARASAYLWATVRLLTLAGELGSLAQETEQGDSPNQREMRFRRTPRHTVMHLSKTAHQNSSHQQICVSFVWIGQHFDLLSSTES
jgi:hypothetical protein